jgi:hypothetical protein
MDVEKYMESARIWKEHTASQEFANAFTKICEEYKHNNDKRAEKIEDF